jgi:protein gp37
MGEHTTIEWADHTFNPWTGCERVSEGCKNCYAERLSKRNLPGIGKWGKNGTRPRTAPATWAQPLRWDKKAEADGVRRRVFCASHADVFEDRPELVEPRDDMWNLIADTPHLDWLLLTKRPENIGRAGSSHWDRSFTWLDNVWLGTTVESDQHYDRIDILRAIPAHRRFLSCEPLLGPLDLTGRLEGIHWVIAGGESGTNARPMHPDWVRQIRDACVTECDCVQYPTYSDPRLDGSLEKCDDCFMGRPSTDPAFFFKQWGHKAAGRELDGRTWDEVPL